jgi:hypothetical protein
LEAAELVGLLRRRDIESGSARLTGDEHPTMLVAVYAVSMLVDTSPHRDDDD